MSSFVSKTEKLTSIFENYNESFSMKNLTNSIENIDNKSQSKDKQQIVKLLQQEATLVWILFGSIGNLLSFVILCSKKMRIHSTFTYLTLLAVCDTLVLYFGLLRDYLVNKYDINVQGEIFCKLHVFLFYFVLHMASWLLVAVNVDRLIAASFLSLSKRWCTPMTALKVSFWIAISLVILNAHFLFFVESSKDKNSSSLAISILSNTQKNKFNKSTSFQSGYSNLESLNNIPNKFTNSNEINAKIQIPINPFVYQKCLVKSNSPKYSYFFHRIFTWIDAGTQVILPFMIMVICNVNIIYKVLLNKNKTNGKNVKRLRKIKGMCVMIVSVSVIFFVLEAPVLIFICFGIDQTEWAYTDLLWTIINMMMYTNHVINFFSYCMTGTKFRRELLRILMINEIFKSFNTFIFGKNNQASTVRCKNLEYNLPNFTQYEATKQNELELKEIHNSLLSNKKNYLTNQIIAKKSQLSSSENAVNNYNNKNKTIRKLVMNKIKLDSKKENDHDNQKSSEISGSCSSLTRSLNNSNRLLKRFSYRCKNESVNVSLTYLAKNIVDLDKINLEDNENETYFKK